MDHPIILATPTEGTPMITMAMEARHREIHMQINKTTTGTIIISSSSSSSNTGLLQTLEVSTDTISKINKTKIIMPMAQGPLQLTLMINILFIITINSINKIKTPTIPTTQGLPTPRISTHKLNILISPLLRFLLRT